MKKLIAGLAVAALGVTGVAAPVFAKGEKAPGTSTLADLVAASPDHNYLEAALVATGLDAVLDTPGIQLTLFAPDDAAFERVADELAAAGIGDGTVGTLLGFLVANDLADDVLLYHVTDGRRFSNSVVPRNGEKSIETLLGPSLTAKVGGFLMDASPATADAQVTTANLSASNGVLHVIDDVLVPLS
jgi:uncharacterized surface protein with fasciclin (FAS1) repeats